MLVLPGNSKEKPVAVDRQTDQGSIILDEGWEL